MIETAFKVLGCVGEVPTLDRGSFVKYLTEGHEPMAKKELVECMKYLICDDDGGLVFADKGGGQRQGSKDVVELEVEDMLPGQIRSDVLFNEILGLEASDADGDEEGEEAEGVD
eukprot:gnl/Chilomastix_caulleri/3883.p1 GENE.gnl/Chilomastix_caulleri/3883~~gnl/Chilomastix_caulleri/3883.p1  ORF type:complete len:114 (+),score=50.18 gnl/Chilomastix_caulleri/3883:103-444(+)